MATDLNSISIIGRLTRDPETREAGQSTVTRFSIANNETYNKQDKTSFFNCLVWGKLGSEVVQKYAKKGSRVSAVGRLQQSSWTDKNGDKKYSIEIKVSSFSLLDTRKDSQQGGQEDQGMPDEQPPLPPEDNSFCDDEIPF